MSEATNLHRATPADAAAIRALVREAYAKWVPVTGREPIPMRADYAAAIAAHRFDLLRVADDLVGLIETKPQDAELLIINVAVRPAFQGRGLGLALMRHAETLAAEAGLSAVRLFTNRLMAWNIAFYRSLGYTVEREETFPDAVAVHMVKPLA